VEEGYPHSMGDGCTFYSGDVPSLGLPHVWIRCSLHPHTPCLHVRCARRMVHVRSSTFRGTCTTRKDGDGGGPVGMPFPGLVLPIHLREHPTCPPGCSSIINMSLIGMGNDATLIDSGDISRSCALNEGLYIQGRLWRWRTPRRSTHMQIHDDNKDHPGK
jgi:hypothetical protein